MPDVSARISPKIVPFSPFLTQGIPEMRRGGHTAGVVILCLSPSCRLSITRNNSGKLRPHDQQEPSYTH